MVESEIGLVVYTMKGEALDDIFGSVVAVLF